MALKRTSSTGHGENVRIELNQENPRRPYYEVRDDRGEMMDADPVATKAIFDAMVKTCSTEWLEVRGTQENLLEINVKSFSRALNAAVAALVLVKEMHEDGLGMYVGFSPEEVLEAHRDYNRVLARIIDVAAYTSDSLRTAIEDHALSEEQMDRVYALAERVG